MKRLAAFLLLSLFAAQTALAHPPSDIHIAFDSKYKNLKITISHSVTNPASHFAETIKIMVNKEERIVQTLIMQDTDAGQYLQYTLPNAKSGDRIRVEVLCNSYGKKMKEYRVK